MHTYCIYIYIYIITGKRRTSKPKAMRCRTSPYNYVVSTTYISKIRLESTGNRPPNALLCLEHTIDILFRVKF